MAYKRKGGLSFLTDPIFGSGETENKKIKRRISRTVKAREQRAYAVGVRRGKRSGYKKGKSVGFRQGTQNAKIGMLMRRR